MTDQDALEVWAERTVREALLIAGRYHKSRDMAFIAYVGILFFGLWTKQGWLCLAAIPFGLWVVLSHLLLRRSLHKMRGEQQLWLLRNVRNAALREQVTADLESKY